MTDESLGGPLGSAGSPPQTAVASREQAGVAALEHVLGTGDLSQMSNEERVGHYLRLCRSLGLNPLSRPFDWIEFDKRLVLYPNQSCAAQLRRQHQIRIQVTRKEPVGDFFCVEVKGTTPDGREDFASKYVPLSNQYGRLTGQLYANAIMKAECVPVESEILTRDGWRTYDQLGIGQEVLAYDLDADGCRWTPLQAVTVYDEALTVRVGTAVRGFRCTPDHSWAVEHPAYRPDRRGGGSRGPRGPYASRRSRRQLLDATHVSKSDRIVLAAPAPGGDHALTPHEAAILGWIMTDGSIRRKATHVRCTIYQSKPNRIEEIEQLVAASGYHAARVTVPATTRDFAGIGRYGGGVSECLPQRRWVFSAYDSRALLAKAGIEQTTDMIGLVTRLSVEARRAMLSAMMAGDGDTRGHFGTKTKAGVMEAWEILATLQGYALGNLSAEDRDVRVRRLRSQRVLHGMNLSITEPAVERVWCPTTAYGTWVMRQGEQIAITGNTGAKRRLTFSMVGLAVPPDPDDAGSWRPVIVDGTGMICQQPTPEQKYLASTPAAARAIGEPVFEDSQISEDESLPSQAVRPEELEQPRRSGQRATFTPSAEDVERWQGTWFATVKGSSLDHDDERHRFVEQWTESRTASLRDFFATATARQAEDLLAHVRAIVSDERRAIRDSNAGASRRSAPPLQVAAEGMLDASQEDDQEREAF